MTLFSRKFLLIIVLLFAFTIDYAFTVTKDHEGSGSNDPKIMRIAEGYTGPIPCTDNVSQIIDKVHWYKNGTELKPPQVDSDKGNNLMFSSITSAADGTYVCKNGDEDHSVIRTITLIVTPSSNNPKIMRIAEGYTGPIPCTDDVSQIIDKVHWYKNGTELKPPQVDSAKGNNLMFSSITTAADGTYVCKNGDEDHSVIRTITLIVTPKCPDFTTVDEEALNNFLSLEQFNDEERALEYGECLKKAVRALIDKQTKPGEDDVADAIEDSQLNITMGNLTVTLAQLKVAQDELDELKHIKNGYNVTMVPELVGIPPGEKLVVWCSVTDSEEEYTFSWFWAPNNSDDVDGYHFDWPPGLNKSNAISANHNYSELYAPSADIAWSGRFFCLTEKKGGNDVPRLYHVDVEVAYPIQTLHLIGNEKHSNRTVPIKIPHGSPLEVSCTATGEWAPPAVNMSAGIGEDQVIVNSSSVPPNKTTTAILKLDWPKINGKDVLIICEAKDNQYGHTKNASSEVIVTNPIKSSKLIWNGTCLNKTISIDKPSGTELEVNCTAIGMYAPPDTVHITAQIGKEPVGSKQDSYSDPKNNTTTVKLTIPWETVNGKDVNVLCEAKGERNSKPDITSSILKVSNKPTGEVPTPTTSNITSTSWGSFGTPTVFGGIATILVVVVVIGVVVVAYRSRDKLRTWIMEKDVSKAALRKAKYARAKGGKGWIKYAKLPRDISEAMSHNE